MKTNPFKVSAKEFNKLFPKLPKELRNIKKPKEKVKKGKMKILGHKYRIQFDQHLDKKSGTVANCCTNILRIKIDPNFPDSRIEEGLLHEIFEAIKYHMNFGESMPHTMLSQISEALYQVMKDNPRYFKIEVKK